jgi:hypothetical protein
MYFNAKAQRKAQSSQRLLIIGKHPEHTGYFEEMITARFKISGFLGSSGK